VYDQNYRKAREQAGVKAEQAASTLGVSITTLFNWERGDTSPDADKLIDMSKLYGTSVNYLLKLD
jgi:transcriptional regulator with XRE-family HTH domain